MTIGTCLAFLLLAAQAAVPQPPASPPPPVFPGGTELVTVDVVVVDGKGQPLEALTREDFQVLENGKPREIVTFEEVRVPPAPAAPPAAPQARPHASSNTDPPPARTFVIVFDELHMRPAAAKQAKEAVALFLKDGTRPGDRVMLVPTAAGRSWTDTMPDGRADLLALLEKMAGKAPPLGAADYVTDWEAYRITVHKDERTVSTVHRRFMENGAIAPCMPPPGTSDPCTMLAFGLEQPALIMAKASEVYTESLRRREATLRVLDATMESLATIKGRKSVLLVSEGFVLDPAQTEMHEVYEAARRANTAINFVDARGLFPVDTTLVDGGRITQATGSPSGRVSNDLGDTLSMPALLSEGSQALAAQTGGQTFKNTNDLGRGFARLAQESSVYYLLGYAPPSLDRDGKFRKIEVKVTRPRTEVRARRGYVVPREADLRQRAGSEKPAPPPLGDASNLPLRMAAYTMDETSTGNVRVVIAGEADASVFGWEPREDKFEDALDTTLNVYPRGTADVKTDSRVVELSLPPRAHEQILQTWLPIVREVELGPGVYQAQLAVRERNAGRAGWVRHGLEVPAPGTFRLTTPILSDLLQPGAAGAAPRIAPLARRSFPRGSKLYCSFDVLNAGRDPQSQAKVRAGHVLRQVGGATLSRMEPSPVPAAADGRLSRTLAISLKTAKPGPHELVLTVQDDVANRTVETVEAFEVGAGGVVADVAPPVPSAGAPAAAPAALPGPRMVEPRATLQRAEQLAGAGGAQARQWGIAAALMLETLGRFGDASARLDTLAKQAPGDPDVLLALGALAESHVDAVAGRGVELPPAGSESLPRFQREAGRERALRDVEARYRGVLAARPADAEARLRLGRVLQLRGDREALQHLEPAAKGHDADLKSLALLFLGEWHETTGQLTEAIGRYRQALAAAPHAQSACIALAQALLRNGHPAAAREAVEKGLAAPGLDPFLTYERPALRLGSRLVDSLEKEGAR